MSINPETSLAIKLTNVGAINNIGIDHRVYEQRVRTTDNLKLQLKSDDVGDRVKIRGLFIPSDVKYSKYAAIELWIAGFKINSIPMNLISLLNSSKVPNYMDLSFDVFFSDSIYLHLADKLCVCELRFVKMPSTVTSVEVLFDCCWLSNKELARMKGAKFEHFFKQVVSHTLLDGEQYIQNNLTIQNMIVCDKKDNIKSVKYDCVAPDEQVRVSVFNYDERLVSIYGVEVNNKVTVFSMNPSKPWDCHYPEGNFNANRFDRERLKINRKNEGDGYETFDVYFLATNQLSYQTGMCGPRFAW